MTPKRRGRPRVDPDDTSQLVTVTLATKEYDRLEAEARRQAISLPAAIRQALARDKTPSAGR